jgi:hypothetical protein
MRDVLLRCVRLCFQPLPRRGVTEKTHVILLGVYSALFVFATSFVLYVFRTAHRTRHFPFSREHDRCRSPPSMTRGAMLAMSAVMYAVSASHCALNVADSLKALEIGHFSRTPVKQIVVVYLPTINVRPLRRPILQKTLADRPWKYILSDGIVLWRAWVLWNRRCLLFVPPLFTLVCTFGEHHLLIELLAVAAVLSPQMTSLYFLSNLCRCRHVCLRRLFKAYGTRDNDEPVLRMVYLEFLC